MEKKPTNREVAASPEFVALCAKHNVKPTKRQVSKVLNQKGQLFRAVLASR